jgi:predicted nucleotidyltransferase
MAASANTAYRLLRRFVLATSVPPLLEAYRGVYGLVTRLALRLFRSYPSVRAVYLTRGSAKGEIVPLVSDIDLLVIQDGLTRGERAKLIADYGRLVRRTRLLDAHLEILDETWLRRQIAMDDHFRYRFAEGKSTWKLLYGRDYLAELPVPERSALEPGLIAEIKVWWMLLVWRLLGPRKNRDEPIVRNSICYKAVSEVLKAIGGLAGEQLLFERAGALKAGIEGLDQPGRALVLRLQEHRLQGFRTPDPSIVADTMAFLLVHLDRFYGHARTLPTGRTDGQRINPDAPLSEVPGGEPMLAAAQALTPTLKRLWGGAFRGASLVPSIHFNLDELLLLVAVDPERPPSFDLLAAAAREHRSVKGSPAGRLRLFLMLANAAFQLDADDLEQSWQSILWPPSNPDVFALATDVDRCVAGAVVGGPPPPGTGPLIRSFLRSEDTAFGELVEDPAVYKLETLPFLRVFWKTAQLRAVQRGASPGELVLPLTPPAVVRALAAQGCPLPGSLTPLVAAYHAAVDGRQPDMAALVPDAVAYLKEIRA